MTESVNQAAAHRIDESAATVEQQKTESGVPVNPFTSEGALSRKADYILTHSTITRSQLHIADPDVIANCDVTTPSRDVSANGHAPPGVAPAGERNGGMVEAVVRRTTVAPAHELKAEQVTIESGRDKSCCTCCTVS